MGNESLRQAKEVAKRLKTAPEGSKTSLGNSGGERGPSYVRVRTLHKDEMGVTDRAFVTDRNGNQIQIESASRRYVRYGEGDRTREGFARIQRWAGKPIGQSKALYRRANPHESTVYDPVTRKTDRRPRLPELWELGQ
jgi:hypothetical protein